MFRLEKFIVEFGVKVVYKKVLVYFWIDVFFYRDVISVCDVLFLLVY